MKSLHSTRTPTIVSLFEPQPFFRGVHFPYGLLIIQPTNLIQIVFNSPSTTEMFSKLPFSYEIVFKLLNSMMVQLLDNKKKKKKIRDKILLIFLN